MVQGEQRDLRDIEAWQLQKALRANRATAAGCDAWSPAELRHPPLGARRRLASMLKKAEQGMPWPTMLRIV
eukprot:10244951-Alexandrium_andersonii.AAC.1